MTSYLLIFIGIVIDISSCFFNSKKSLRRGGVSGILVIPAVLYLLVFLWDRELVVFAKTLDVAIFIGIHLALQYGIPSLFYQRKDNSRNKKESKNRVARTYLDAPAMSNRSGLRDSEFS
ncbi:hypothetical protein CWB98_16945 [Pseudoalteromonas rubra]|uniref:Uncharacterized protein n=1 Tax=Pseudoalteromonas rubra TaxID=43658 RepID=A0A5S3WXT6_9GAMM|nr:hypothetical protein CWB98_16945 [Pseudoalteromonas rubra]